jgi:hypothetical protein
MLDERGKNKLSSTLHVNLQGALSKNIRPAALIINIKQNTQCSHPEQPIKGPAILLKFFSWCILKFTA